MSSDLHAPVRLPAASSRGGVAVRVQGLSKIYRVGVTEGIHRYRSLREDVLLGLRGRKQKDDERLLWALRDVDFEVREGETVGIIGRNGAGKSTLLKILSEITPPTAGRAEVRGRVGTLLEVGMGFHPELTGRDNIFLAGAVLGMKRAEIARKLDEIVDFSGVERFLSTPVKRYSTGMYLRLAFAVAAYLEPDVLLVDEVLAVGDADFQKKCLGRMADLGTGGRTVLFVSHSMPAVLRLCPRIVLLDGGRVIADGPAHEVVRTYLDTGLGSTAERAWPDTSQAPGDDVVRLHAVRVRDHTGKVSEEIDVRHPVTVEVEYVHRSPDPSVRPAANLHFTNDEGVLLFVSADFNDRDWAAAPREPGLVRATCRIPANFLAEGKIYVLAAVSTFNPLVVHAMVPDAVAFQVVDRSDGEAVRGDYAAPWPGAVRPMLDWTIDTEERNA
ncbi:MAG: ABC transporter ATP-binding protein [Candidatus Binatia bacterium]